MLAGHPGLGKSQLTASMAAIVTTGGLWPVDKTRCERGNVVFFSAEDDAEDTIRPRLEAAGADLDRIFILDAVMEGNGTRPRAFNLKADLPRLGQMLEYIGDVALVVIDPVTAYLGDTDSHKNADIRALLSPLGELASRHGAAVVCVSHLNKGGAARPSCVLRAALPLSQQRGRPSSLRGTRGINIVVSFSPSRTISVTMKAAWQLNLAARYASIMRMGWKKPEGNFSRKYYGTDYGMTNGIKVAREVAQDNKGLDHKS